LKRGLDKKFENEVNAYKKGLIISTVQREVINQSPSEITQREIEDYYNENENKYTNFRIKRINIKDQDMADEIKRRLNSGEDIENIAEDHSLKAQSFDVRGLPFDQNYKDQFDGYDVGSVSDILNRENEFEILIIVGKSKVPLPKVYNTIKYMLQEQMAKKAIQEFAENLKEKNKINGGIDEILYQEGIKRGLDKQLQDNVEGYKRRLIVNDVNREIVKNLITELTEKDIEDFYNDNEINYTHFKVKRIITNDKNAANEIHKRLTKGEDIENIASDYSLKVENATIRDWGFENNKYIGLLKGKEVGSVLDIIETKNRFEIIKIIDIRKIPLTKVKPHVKFNLLKDIRSKAINNLKEENEIIVEFVENKEES
jgi:hypothetical protein